MSDRDRLIRYVDCYLDCRVCNLRCSYCYLAQRKEYDKGIARIEDIDKLKRALSLKRMGGLTLFNICSSGETLLHPDIVNVVSALLEEGHYVSLVTNGTATSTIDELIASDIDIEKVFFKFSFHYRELVRTGLLQTFSNNINKIRKARASFSVEVVGSDDNVPFIKDIKKFSLENFGALPHVTLPRDDRTEGIDLMTKYPIEEYKAIWEQFHSDLFDFKMQILGVKRKEYCMAGEWSLSIDLNSGNYSQCLFKSYLGNIYNDIDKPLLFEPVGHECKLPYCYNGHAYLTLGVVREYETPSYFQMRNRILPDGSEWFTKKMKVLFEQKLYSNHI